MTNEELMGLGDEAEALLNTPTFNKTVNSLVDACFQKFANTAPEDAAAREQSYNLYRGLVEIVNTLQQRVAVRDQIRDEVGLP